MRRRAPWQGTGARGTGGAQFRRTGGTFGKQAFQVPRATPVGQWRFGGRGVASRARKPSAFLTKNSGELKGMDTDLTFAGPVIDTVNTSLSSSVLNLVEPGNGSFNRIGRKVFNKTVRLKGMVQFKYADVTTTENLVGACMRMIVVWDKQPTGTQPQFDAICGRTSQDGTETSDVFDNLRYDNTARFQILREVMFTGNPTANPAPTAGTENAVVLRFPFDEFIDLKNRTTVFSGDSDPVTIADISSGALYVYWRANAAVNNQLDWEVETESHARLRFTS